tara:strand:- start:1126 stop:1401 length:276 start_codon:yes stop_codon:yes gene_type:complete
MADVILTFQIMPESPEEDLKVLEEKAKIEIENFGGEVGKVEVEPVAFGLKAINIIFVMDEEKGGTEDLEELISKIKGIQSVKVTDVRRAFG